MHFGLAGAWNRDVYYIINWISQAGLYGIGDRFDRLGHPGVREIVAAHLLELWAVQCVGADTCGGLLARAAGLVDGHGVFRDPRTSANGSAEA